MTKDFNPWLAIPYTDYEKHMLDKKVGQLKVLKRITKDILQQYAPQTFVLLGCATGNGLEYIDNRITKKVVVLDINPKYLNVLKQRYGNSIENLLVYEADLSLAVPSYCKADLILGALILEYVDIEIAIKNVVRLLKKNGIFVAVIQDSNKNEFVTKTKISSLNALKKIGKTISREKLNMTCQINNLYLLDTSTIDLPGGKKFYILSYKYHSHQ